MNKTIIEKNFSKHAGTYDSYTDVQKKAAETLVSMLPGEGIGNILEIGCGTGNYTAMLKSKFKFAKIKAVDISTPMISLARQKFDDGIISFEAGDAEEMDLGSGYDLITSNAVFHWLKHLDSMFEKIRRALSPGGAVIFSIFGPKTFLELKQSLVTVTNRKISIASDVFAQRGEIEKILLKYFKDVKIDDRPIKERYLGVHELLKKIKYSGTQGDSACMRKVWSPGLLKKIEREYIREFGSVEATYQIFFCQARAVK